MKKVWNPRPALEPTIAELFGLSVHLTKEQGEKHYRAGVLFRRLKKISGHGEYQKAVALTGFSLAHARKLKALADGIERLGIPREQIRTMTFDKMTDAVRIGEKPAKGQLNAHWTPTALVEVLLERETFTGLTWEPAVGSGRIASALVERGHEVFASDIYDHEYPGTVIGDFYGMEPPRQVQNIVTNPPYDSVQRWLKRCVWFKPYKIALLVQPFCLAAIHKQIDRTPEYSLTRLLMVGTDVKFSGHSGKAVPTYGVCWFVLTRQKNAIGQIENINI